ncbi:hypothetical protein [Paenibacillus ginsengihumi]|uniref:hypothetical protein n=1 Tax=Paenibacillus ginsengihumi TaxID=431596 RepID=UPI00039B6CB4|nr:hypothetical protein [Paenibacillus ginsengihumi]
MLKTLKTLLAIRTAAAVNLFVYYIRKLPLMGRLITDRFYARLKLKKTLSAIMLVIILLWGFVSKLLYVGLMAYWPATALGGERLLLGLPSALAVLVVGLIAVAGLARYSGYRNIVDAAAKRDDPLMDIGRMIAEAQAADVRTREDDYISPAADGGKLSPQGGLRLSECVVLRQAPETD